MKDGVIDIILFVEGECIELLEVKDDVFVLKVMGEGIVVLFIKGVIIVFIDCEVVFLFLILYVIGLKLDNGVEMLIYVGINIVELNGKYFIKYVN